MRFFQSPTVLVLLGTILGGALPATIEAGQAPQPAAADFSGVRKFLDLTTTLEADKEPSPDEWDALFMTPGYDVLLKREFRRDFFVERFRLAFMPSRADALTEQMKKDTGFAAQFLPHYLRAKAMRRDIERWLAEQEPEELYDAAIGRRARCFPTGPPGAGLPSPSSSLPRIRAGTTRSSSTSCSAWTVVAGSWTSSPTSSTTTTATVWSTGAGPEHPLGHQPDSHRRRRRPDRQGRVGPRGRVGARAESARVREALR